MKKNKLLLSVLLGGSLFFASGCNANSAPVTTTNAPAQTTAAKTESTEASKVQAESSAAADVKWPAGAIQILVPSKAGGITDLHSRYIQEWWQKSTGANMAVVNFDNEAVAYEQLRSSKPDGSTILAQHTTILCKYITGAVDFDPTKELRVVAKLQYMGDNALIAAPDAPYNTMEEMVEYAKAHPGELSAAISTNGTTHFIWGSIMKETGINLKLVEASSETDKLTNVAGGFISLGNVSLANAKQYEEAGKIKVLGILGRGSDNPDFPQWKDVTSQGINVTWRANIYFFVPVDTPEALCDKINESLKDMVNDTKFQENMKTVGGEADWANCADSQAAFDGEMDNLKAIATSLGINKR